MAEGMSLHLGMNAASEKLTRSEAPAVTLSQLQSPNFFVTAGELYEQQPMAEGMSLHLGMNAASEKLTRSEAPAVTLSQLQSPNNEC